MKLSPAHTDTNEKGSRAQETYTFHCCLYFELFCILCVGVFLYVLCLCVSVVFIVVTILGFVKHGFHYFALLAPPGLPFYMLPILIPIELISYLSRPISLSVRLFANMLAGHTLLKVFAGFVLPLGIAGVLPFAFIVALTGLEILIAFLQAYVFAILTCMYINDAIHLH